MTIFVLKAASFSETATNKGTYQAAASVTKYYLSSNTTWEITDLELGFRAVGPLAPGASSTFTKVLTVPANTPTGTYYIIAKADATAVVIEYSETNNTKYKQITVAP